MRFTIVRLLLILGIMGVPLVVFFINPRSDLLSIVMGFVLPFGFTLLHVAMDWMIAGFRNDEEEEFALFLVKPHSRVRRLEVKTLEDLPDLIRTVPPPVEVVIEPRPPTFTEISIGIALIISAISALVASNFVFYLEALDGKGNPIVPSITFFLLVFNVIIALLIIIFLRVAKEVGNKKIRTNYIVGSNLLGFVALFLSFVVLSYALI